MPHLKKNSSKTVCLTIFINDKILVIQFPFMAKIFALQFPFMGKLFIIEFSYNFVYVWNCMELYEKKFPIYENCMISIFSQPAVFCFFKVRFYWFTV